MAWDHVRRAGGGCGADGETLAMVAADLDNQLYKIWNRLSSGSYMAQPVKLVQIPKVGGGKRTLGVPNVTDKVAQMVIKSRLEPLLEPHFHPDSYAYRPGRSALDAVGVVRERCFQHRWVIDLDIKSFFDTLDHELLMEMVRAKTDDETIHLYAERFLKAQGITESGETVERISGTPQGGVVSPLLANLYLHEAFDRWMQASFPEVRWTRFADDILVHCVSENQAYFLLNRIKGRLKQYKLQVHEEKTRIVYTGKDAKGPDSKVPRSFTYLGYEFKPRTYRNAGITSLVFTPAMSQKAQKLCREKMQSWKLKHRVCLELEEIAAEVNAVIRGWIMYYGRYRRSALYYLARDIDQQLVRWLKRKHKSLHSYDQAWNKLQELKKKQGKLFYHWYNVATPTRAV